MRKTPVFSADLLTATEWDTAEAKAKWGNALVAFVMGGFRTTMFHKTLYRRLSMCFGHIAEYNQSGFYSVWFADSRKQLKWVKYILDHRVCGDPAFTFSDVERQFKAWLATHKAEVEEVILRNLGEEERAALAESNRVAALSGKRSQQFKVAAVSSNTGDFGHNQFVMVAQDGTAYRVHHIQSNGQWVKGQVFDVPLNEDGTPNWFSGNLCVECPERLSTCPAKIVAEVWGGSAA